MGSKKTKEIKVRLARRGDGCVAVVVRHGDRLYQTPWLIGAGEEARREVARKLKIQFPEHKITCC